MTAKTPPADLGRGKPTVAAAIFIIAFLLSATMMIWSGWQLYHGEKLPAAVAATGQACEWVVLLDTPGELAVALDALATHAGRQLPEGATATLAAARPFFESMRTQGPVTDQPYVLCGFGREAVLTMPNRLENSRAADEAKQWSKLLAKLAGDPSATALDVTPNLLRLAFAPSSHDTTKLLQRAAPSGPAAHLGVDVDYRAAVERVGGGAAHFYLPKSPAQRLLQTLSSAPWLAEGIATVQWLGLGLRRDDDRIRVHAHVGMDQHGAIWLKEVADVAALDDATGWIAADATAAAIVRLPANLRAKVAGRYGPRSPLLAQALAQAGADKAQTLVWQRAPDGSESVLWTADVPPLPDLPTVLAHTSALTQACRVTATTPAMLARTQAVLEGTQPSQGKVADRDRQRLLTNTQGWFDGPLQIDWVWTDMGLAAEAAWHL